MSEPFDLGSLTEEFRDEARGQADALDAGLLELEREGALTAEKRSALLRTLHTLKGNAGMLGFSELRDFVHVLENLLKEGRSGWDEASVERLFEGAAALRSAIEASGTEAQEQVFRELTAARHRLEEVAAVGPAPADRPGDRAPTRPESPPSSDLLRVPFAKLDTLLSEVGELLGELDALRGTIEGRRLGRLLRDRTDALRLRGDRVRDLVMSLRLVPIGRVMSRFHGLVRRLAREQGKEARLVVEGESTEVDKSTADALAEPLLHLVRNAIDHGIETPDARERSGKPRHGTVRIAAWQAGDRLFMDVEDDGAGLSERAIRDRAVEAGLIAGTGHLRSREVLELIFRAGFSTRADVSTVSGRGVGLDVVRRTLRGLRGHVWVERTGSGGTRFRMRLPLTVAVIPALVFRTAGELLAVPTSHVARTFRLDRIERIGTIEAVRDPDGVVPLAVPGRLFGWGEAGRGVFGVVVWHGDRRVAVTADELVDQRDLVVKALPAFTGRVPMLSGASVLPGGRVILVLDPAGVVDLNAHRGDGGSG